MNIYTGQDVKTEEGVIARFEQYLDAMNGIVPHSLVLEAEQAGDKSKKRQAKGIASVEAISRTGHFFRIDGIDLSFYKKNPVVLANHVTTAWGDNSPQVIGTAKVTKKDNTLPVVIDFDDDPISEMWWQKVSKKIIRMMSIGTIPVEWEYAEKTVGRGKDKRAIPYIDMVKTELVEISVCPIGANRGAMFEGYKANARIRELEKSIETTYAELLGVKEQIRELLDGKLPEKGLDGDSPANPTDSQLSAIDRALEGLNTVTKE